MFPTPRSLGFALCVSFVHLTAEVCCGQEAAVEWSLSLPGRNYVDTVAFSPDGRRMLVVENNDIAHGVCSAVVWDFARGQPGCGFSSGEVSVFECGTFSHDSQRVLVGDENGSVQVRDADSGKLLMTLEKPTPGRGGRNQVHCLTCSTYGKWFTAGYASRTAVVWDATNGQKIRERPALDPHRAVGSPQGSPRWPRR